MQRQKASVGTETGRACSRGQPRPRTSPSTLAWSSLIAGELDMSLIDLDCLRHYLSALYFRMIAISGYCQLFPANETPALSVHLPDFEEKRARDPCRHQTENQRGKGGGCWAQSCPNPQNPVPIFWHAGSTYLSWIFIIKALLGTP